MSDWPKIYDEAARAEQLFAPPAELVPLGVGAFGEAWTARNHSPTLLKVLNKFAAEEARTFLKDLGDRAAPEALCTAWARLRLIYERLLTAHGFLPGSIADVLADAEANVNRIAGKPPKQ
ncbi:hypothetical protein J4573_30325 [Actinomadura barringtoniae]|uniref:Uncharacterized protein n=1 Tax=Actinomadura barringtoniae TaxID=1427535 RepID=A0A939PF07_9ACTN|nr:hypothetical protein [Actinomadura barringtoniae]MBO2451421.1 hypothetical protein [Actinomadura barringtoniae]